MRLKEKQKARQLRKRGFSLDEIADTVHASKSSVSQWVRGMVLSDIAQKRIESRLTKGQLAARKARYIQTAYKEQVANKTAISLLKTIKVSRGMAKLLCAMIYYCEGMKSVYDIRFTNSDPGLIQTFLILFRESFKLNEKKFRICVHLHSYHNKNDQLNFWSKVSNIPLAQFMKPYLKPTSGRYKKEGYQGCVSIRYGDVRIARELRAIALEFMKRGL